MTSHGSYSPLESLLLLQSVLAAQHHGDAFKNISESLRQSLPLQASSSPSVASSADRFKPEALQDLYLRLLTDEATKQQSKHLRIPTSGPNGIASSGPGSSDGNPSPGDATDPTTATPERKDQLACAVVDKLYAQYKDQVIREIRAEEQRYDTLVKELHALEASEKDKVEEAKGRKKMPAAAAVSTSTSISASQPYPTTTGSSAQSSSAAVLAADRSKQSPLSQTPAVPAVQSAAAARIESLVPKPSSTPVAIDAKDRTLHFGSDTKSDKDQTQTQRQAQVLAPAKGGSNLPSPILNPSLQQQQQQQQHDLRAQAQLGANLPSQAQVHPSQQPQQQQQQQQPQQQNNAVPVPTVRSSPTKPSAQLQTKYAAANTPSSHDTQSQTASISSHTQSRPPTPISLQQNTPTHTAASLQQHVQTPHQPLQQQQRTQGQNAGKPSSSTKTKPALQNSTSTSSQARIDDIRKYVTQTPGRYPPTANQAQPSAATPHTQKGQSTQQPPHRGGIILPPFQLTPQPAASASAQGSASNAKAHAQTGHAPSSSRPRPPQSLSIPRDNITRVIQDLASYSSPRSPTPANPLSAVSSAGIRRSHTHMSPGSTTRWKGSVTTPTSSTFPPDRLRPRSISPFSDTEEEQKPASTKTEGHQLKQSDRSTVQRVRRGTRGASVTPSAAATTPTAGPHSRSPSVASHADELSMSEGKADNQARYKTDSITMSDADDRIDASLLHPLRAGKRKRSQDSHDERPPQSALGRLAGSPAKQQLHIQAYRNFSRMVNPVMNTINSHKHASLFAHPVKERDAEGYTDIIRRPQDLKSIRAAISTGSRAVAAATAQMASESMVGSPGGASPASPGGTVVVLPYSSDIVPPKGIVNGAQLEQEVMRMFANAVMFNPGSEGVVQDTREMFDTVEPNITNWRALERSSAIAGGGNALGGMANNTESTTGAGESKTGGASIDDEEADELAGDSHSHHHHGAAHSMSGGAGAGAGAGPVIGSMRKRSGRS